MPLPPSCESPMTVRTVTVPDSRSNSSNRLSTAHSPLPPVPVVNTLMTDFLPVVRLVFRLPTAEDDFSACGPLGSVYYTAREKEDVYVYPDGLDTPLRGQVFGRKPCRQLTSPASLGTFRLLSVCAAHATELHFSLGAFDAISPPEYGTCLSTASCSGRAPLIMSTIPITLALLSTLSRYSLDQVCGTMTSSAPGPYSGTQAHLWDARDFVPA